MSEFSLIRRYFDERRPFPDIALGIGDDCALLQPPAGCELAVTTDTLIGGVHFPRETPPQAIGWKALAVNLSDLAAMGAEPLAFLLALTVPEADERWLAEFAHGLFDLAHASGIALVGGDITRGPLSITITAIGKLPTGAALRRSGAKVGDAICVTGTLGDAALALALAREASPTPDTAAGSWLRERLERPTPRLAAGLALRGLAHAAIDLSDGLAGDLGHILEASDVGAEIFIETLPMSPAFARLRAGRDRLRLQAAGGDDYELCVCIAPENLPAAKAALAVLDVPITPIGRITEQLGLRWINSAGAALESELRGYEHFSA